MWWATRAALGEPSTGTSIFSITNPTSGSRPVVESVAGVLQTGQPFADPGLPASVVFQKASPQHPTHSNQIHGRLTAGAKRDSTSRTSGSEVIIFAAIAPARRPPNRPAREDAPDSAAKTAAPDQYGNADEQPQNHQNEIAVGRSGNTNHIVQAHDHVCHHNGADGTPKGAGTLGFRLVCMLPLPRVSATCGQSRPAWPHQQRAGPETSATTPPSGSRCLHHQHRAQCAPNHGTALQVTRHIACRQCDHDGVIPASTRSITTMAARAVTNSILKKSITHTPDIGTSSVLWVPLVAHHATGQHPDLRLYSHHHPQLLTCPHRFNLQHLRQRSITGPRRY